MIDSTAGWQQNVRTEIRHFEHVAFCDEDVSTRQIAMANILFRYGDGVEGGNGESVDICKEPG